MKVLLSWLRELVDVSAGSEEIGQRLHLAGFELAGIAPHRAGAGGDGGDAVIDLEITANRPDCLSMVGIAREVSTLYDTPLKWRASSFPRPGQASTLELQPPRRQPARSGVAEQRRGSEAALGPSEGRAEQQTLRVTIEDADLCPRYCAALADMTVGPSPAWLVDRLSAAGIRSINNIVDVTNYVLLETGHPLHAFDLAKLAGPHLRIRRAAPGEIVKTLDGQTRTLAPEMLVIADADRAQAIAGVMGGADSEVTAATTTIALESAYFHPPSVRRTSKRLGLSTEASYRFERGADPEAAPRALARACELIAAIGAGTVRPGWIDARPTPFEPRALTLRHPRIGRVLGFDVTSSEAERILTSLGFTLTGADVPSVDGHDASRSASSAAGREPGAGSREPEADTSWLVTVPSWRVDVAREIDLVEEVARIHGYDRIPSTFPALTMAPPAPGVRLRRDAVVRAVARALGFSESVTFSFIERDTALRYAAADTLVSIANPLSENFAVMRPALLPGLIGSVAHNRRREQRDVRLFELANRFTRAGGEQRALALAWTGAASATHWSGSGRPVDLYDVTGAVVAIGHALGIELTCAPITPHPNPLPDSARAASGAPKPGEGGPASGEREMTAPFLTEATASAIVAPSRDGEPAAIGALGQLDPAAADAAGLPAREPVFVAELDLDAVLDVTDLGDRIRVTPLPRYPSSVRDLSIVVPLGLPAADIRGTIRGSAPPTLESVHEFDRYQGRGVPGGSCSVSVRLTFRSPERTLTEAEVQTAVDAIVAALAARHQATLRQ